MKKLVLSLFLVLAAIGAEAQTIVTSDSLAINTWSPKFRIAIQGGFAYMFGSIDKSMGEDLVKYYKNLKIGGNEGADITYYIAAGSSVGIKYNRLRSAVSSYGTLTFEDGTKKSGTISDNVSILFIGPYYGVTNAGGGSKHVYALNAGVGYVGYRDDACVIDPFLLTGWTLGYYLGLQYDFMITPKLALGAELALYTGAVKDLYRTENGVKSKVEMENGQAQAASHVDASIGIRFYL